MRAYVFACDSCVCARQAELQADAEREKEALRLKLEAMQEKLIVGGQVRVLTVFVGCGKEGSCVPQLMRC